EVDVEMLTEELRDLFKSPADSVRSQSSVANAGVQWRRFLWCILSMLSTSGNEVPVFGGPMMRSVVPGWIRDMLRIEIGEARGLSHEPDFVLLKLRKPEGTGQPVSGADALRDLLEADRGIVEEVVVIWAKTNFNDNIQGALLWSHISMLQTEGSDPPIRHAWVTVPTNRPDSYSPGTAPFNRASTFDGGAYWGIGRSDVFGMGSIFDIVPDWEERMPQLRDCVHHSELYKRLGLT
ncbi:uncharacterized protein METZ01_LOCUS352763, partial [marine metagenome]